MSNKDYAAIEKIRARYTEKGVSDMDRLRALDARVKRMPRILAYLLGSLSAIVMGAGMSLCMTDLGATLGIGDPMTLGIIIGVCGMVLAGLNYLLYRVIFTGRVKKYRREILELSEKLGEQ